MAATLLGLGADANAATSCGQTPLHLAVSCVFDWWRRRPRGRALQLLPPTACGPAAVFTWQPPVVTSHVAGLTTPSPPRPPSLPTPQATNGHASITRMLLRAGGRVDARDASGSTPLHRAAATGQALAAQALLEDGRARLEAHDKTGATPLLVAVGCQHAEAAIYLATRGADLGAANKAQQTPLSLAGPLAATLQQAAAGAAQGPRATAAGTTV